MKAIKTIKFKSFDDFQLQIVNFDQPELVNCLLEAIQRGMEKGNKKVSVCDIEIEDEDSAKALLKEVQSDGNSRQQAEANSLLKKLT